MIESSASPRNILGVSTSSTGRAWLPRGDMASDAEAARLVQVLGMNDVVARVLAARGIGVETAEPFLSPKLRDLMPDPATITDMGPAVERISYAVTRGEHVAIFGDYDVDGACSAALLSDYLALGGLKPRIHIPDRITEGYGPNVAAIRALRDEGASLLVTVDCGTTSHEPLAEARRIGLDVVVLDHHQAGDTNPEAIAIVNPNRQDDLSGLGHLCAAGVVFMTLSALNRHLRGQGHPIAARADLLAMLDLVALATVADVVPLVGLNRAFVRQGLAVMRQRRRPGLTALLDIAGLDGPPAPWHLGYLVGPRINAGGRIGDAALGARLLTTADPIEAGEIAAQLDMLNRERQVIEQVAVAQGEDQARRLLAHDPDLPVIVVGDEGWHPGIVGLVAARLKESFKRPAFAVALSPDGEGAGSGRSIAGIDIGRAVRAAVEAGAALKGGGHAMAAGIRIAPGGLAMFAQAMTERLRAGMSEMPSHPELLIDATLTAAAARADLVTALEDAGPYGSAAPEPMVALPSHLLADVGIVGNGHVRARWKAGDGVILGAIAFRAAETPLGQALLSSRGARLHVAGTLSIDRWGGGERAQMRMVDIAVPS
jgi:single-stranded-DNA-specific exonuclease